MPSTPGKPKSVAMLDNHPYLPASLKLGTRFQHWITAMQEIYDSVALANELRTRLHTAGDYQALIVALRARSIAGGVVNELLTDLADKAYNHLLTNPGWRQDPGTATDFDNANGIDAIVDGTIIATIVATAANIVPTSPAWDTGAGEERSVTVQVDAAGAVTVVISAAAATGTSVVPRPTAGQCPIGLIVVPQSFTGGVTAAGGCAITQGFPRRLAAPTALAVAAPAAIVATAVDAAAVAAVESLPDRDV